MVAVRGCGSAIPGLSWLGVLVAAVGCTDGLFGEVQAVEALLAVLAALGRVGDPQS
jgi:hypothetical protein